MLASYLRVGGCQVWYGSKKTLQECHDLSRQVVTFPNGRSLRLWRKNWSQLVAFGIIHEITLARAFWPHFATFVTFVRQKITYVRMYVAEVACASLSRPS